VSGLILKRASASQPSGEWNEDDYRPLPAATFIVNEPPPAKNHLSPLLAPSFASPTASPLLGKFDGEFARSLLHLPVSQVCPH
jgi:hypothetical protein